MCRYDKRAVNSKVSKREERGTENFDISKSEEIQSQLTFVE